jgi:hypothetical protein
MGRQDSVRFLYWKARYLITKVIYGMIKNDDDDDVYVKVYEKREKRLKGMLDTDARDNVIIETMDVDYEDTEL